MKKILKLLLILLLFLPAVRALFGPGYFNMHDDLQPMRILEIGKCFADGQIPCRWSPDMAYGYGQAMFNFYSAFPYYVGALIRMITPLSILATVKLLFMISLLGGALGMYLLGKEFWGRSGGFLSAILYTYVPYHALDVYVRGAMAEAFALAILPFLWLGFYRLIKKPSFNKVALTAIAFAALLTTHSVSTMMYAPFTLLWVFYWLFKYRSKETFVAVFFSGLLGIGLAAFFFLPAIFEQSIIQTGFLISDYSDYHAHFVTLYQLFISRHWGDGPSIFGPNDDISFAIGWPHWWLALLMAPALILKMKKKEFAEKAILILSLLALFLFAAFLTHSKSVWIWERVPLMAYIQFSWRFLGLVIFFLSFALGGIVLVFNRFNKVIVIIITILAIALNAAYFTPVHFSSKVTDEQKLSGVAFELQQKSAILDYLPKTAKVAPQAVAFENPKIITGNGEITGFIKRSDSFSFDAFANQQMEVEVPVMYFPGWIAILDSKMIPIQIHGAHGVIQVSIPPGAHSIKGIFQNTPIRSIANAITLISAAILLTGVLISQNKRKIP